MKKIFVLIAAICLCGVALAQPAAGDMIIRGSIGYNTLGIPTYSFEEYGSTSPSYTSALNLWSISPRFEYFVSNRSSIGISGSYMNAWTKSKFDFGDGSSVYKQGFSIFYVGPTYNYYIRLADRFYLSINCFIGYAGMKSWYLEKGNDLLDHVDDRGSTDGCFGLLTVTPTLTYFINDRWLLTASVGSVAGAYGTLPDADNATYYAGANWGNLSLGVGFKF